MSRGTLFPEGQPFLRHRYVVLNFCVHFWGALDYLSLSIRLYLGQFYHAAFQKSHPLRNAYTLIQLLQVYMYTCM